MTHYEYDASGQLKAVVENYQSGQGASQNVNVRTEYGYDGAGNRLTVKDGNTHITTFGYDGLDRQVTERDALSHTTTYSYNAAGWRISQLDAKGQATVYGFDALGRPTTIDYPPGTADVTFTYDALGNRLHMSDGTGTTNWRYDGLSRPISITDPMTGTVLYGYDGSGNRASLTYADGKVVTYAYDGVTG